MAKVEIKPAAIPRAGYEYQDLVGIEVLIRHYRDPELYAWVQLEADDTTYRALDDVVAARKNGSFEFIVGLPDLDGYENYVHDQLVPTDTDTLGWLAFRHYVQQWATNKNQPGPAGRILREHVVQLITKRRPQPIRQDFIVPKGY